MKAVDVISSFINQMKGTLVNELIRRPLGYDDNDIQWVITTLGKLEPPINELMNIAVRKGGINPDQLNIVQGPEAKLMYNRTFTGSPSSFGEEQIAPLPKFYRSLLVHLGGVAINLTMVEKLKYFESDKVVTVRVPPKWYDAYRKFTGDILTNAINQTTFREAVTFQNDKIRISPELFRKFYENATEFTIEMVEKTLAKQSALGIGVVFIAGDHVDHVFVKTLKERYPAHRIIVSKNPELVVMKGAVLNEIME
ncbi:uncharacterized protein LOC134697967 [Mytilus trossulus]|uniref:uncharacterized protein LOC134697967 n=1 Tax=Mytilus trossulus TaxID=6551 RepID=UPI003003BFD4